MRSEAEVRAAIVAEAMSWMGTPFHHAARVKGAGVDCAQLLIAVYAGAGLIEAFPVPHYPSDWAVHRDEPRFLQTMLEYCRPVDPPSPGDLALFQYGRTPSHGGIWLPGNRLLHAWIDEGRVTISDLPGSPLEARLHGYFRWRGFSQ